MMTQTLRLLTPLVFFSAAVSAQEAPICPLPQNVLFSAMQIPFVQPYSTNDTGAVIRRPAVEGIYDFIPQNIVLAGSQISFDAPGQPRHPSQPRELTLIGRLAAGSYTVTIRPIATNTNPDVPCPPLTVPLVVIEGQQHVPVSVSGPLLATLLGSLLTVAGALHLRRRRISH